MSDTWLLLKEVQSLIVQLLPEVHKRRRDIGWKEDGSPVTAADIYLETEISAFLADRLPTLRFIGEESYRPSPTDPAIYEWTAVLDPIDGTENFCSGLREWGVSLSLWRAGVHQGSLLSLPDLGAHLASGENLHYQRSRITGFSSSICEEILDGLAEMGEARILGCAVYNLFNVTRGALSRFVNPRGAHTWDLLAGVQLAREHGCDILIDGAPYDGRFLEPGPKYRVDIRHRYDLHPG